MKIVKIKYDLELLKCIKNKQIVVYVDSLDMLECKFAEAKQNNHVVAFVALLPYTSISQIELKREWAEIPLVIYAYNIGDYDTFFENIEKFKAQDIRIYLHSRSSNFFTDLKIMSSLGIDCGVFFEEGVRVDDEKLLDLASYYYISPVPHATIEPFEFILRHIRDEENVTFDNVYFDNPLLYTDVSSKLNLEQVDLNNDCFDLKMQLYYKHFMNLDECSKCPAFKICNHKMLFKLNSCSETMNEIFEYAEMKNNMKKQQPIKKICQL
jgi:hypothetical protein